MINYHTHTKRCKHAEGEDEAYIRKAIAEGFEVCGFSDHTPWPYRPDFSSHMRMDASELREYVTSIRSLGERFSESVEVPVGLECECFPRYFGWLESQARHYSLDYLIIGCHYRDNEENGLYYGNASTGAQLKDYTADCIQAMKTGLFSCLAHPDLALMNHPRFGSEEEDYTRSICEASLQFDIPLEYNLLGLWKAETGWFKGMGYPAEDFWMLAGKYGCKAVIGCDAHKPLQIDGIKYCKAETMLKSKGLNLQHRLRFI